MKKILIAFLTISLLAAMMAIPVAAAAPAASMNSVSAAPGETVTLTVSLAGIEKATSIGIEIVADEELTYLDSSAWLITGEIAHVDSGKAAWVGNAYVSGDILALEYKLPEGKMAPVYQVRLTIDVVNHPATVAAGLTVTGTITCAHNYIPTVHAPTCTTLGYTSYECGYCGDTSKENDNYVNVSHDWVEATCLAPKTCALCGATEGELGDHAWSNWTVIEEPTCVEEGLRTRSCTREGCDHSESEAIDATGHNYEPDVIPPTCTEEGYTDYICANCGASYMEDKVDALGHDLAQWEITKAPTCTEAGEQTRACLREGCKYTETEKIPATGHNHKPVVTDPTCTEGGYTTYTCACGHSYVADEVKALGHSFTKYVSDENATCTEDGTETAKCDRCDETDTRADEGSAKGHSFTKYVSDENATCTEDGTETAKCDRCDETDTRADEGSAKGHSFTKYVSDENATCTEDGTETAKCDRCDETDTRADEGSAKGHSFTKYVSDENATCTEDGTETAKCDRCDETDTRADEGSAKGHNYGPDNVCVDCGEAAPLDTAPPVVHEVTLSATKVTAPAEVEVIMDASDDMSGIESCYTIFRCVDTDVEISVELYSSYWAGKEGYITYEDGKLHGTISLTEYQKAGDYQLDFISISDKEGNYYQYYAGREGSGDTYGPMPENLCNVVLTVENNSVEDVEPPVLQSVELSATVTNTPAEILVTIKTTDDVTGALLGVVEFYCEETQTLLVAELVAEYWDEEQQEMIPCPEGELRGILRVGENIPDGTYVLNYVYLRDHADNDYEYYRDWESTTSYAGPLPASCMSVELTVGEVVSLDGWTEIDGKWYFYENGAPKTGWHEEGGRYYYFKPDGVMATGWEKITGVWYYMEPSGARAVGWQLINGNYYYFYASGVMKTGWLNSGGKRYFFRPDGAMSTGWVQYGGKWYCMDETGAMVTGWMERGGEKYYMDADGVMVTGTVTIDGTIHEFDENGVWRGSVTPKDGWVQENGKWYFYENGKAKIGWHEEGGKYYYFGTDGAMATGWVKIGQVWYYMEPSGARATGWNLINGSYYYFYSSGVMKTGWLNSGGKRYFFRPDGAMATGWVEYAGNWYYMNESGAMVTGTYTIKGVEYKFDSNGVWIP